jgi:uncharacterized protein RhaS with RHS repeats
MQWRWGYRLRADNGHRYYHPGTGRYLRSGPIGLAGGLSIYGYVAGNPLGAADPQGLAQQCYRADDEVVETPKMKAAYNRLTDFATQAANTVDATCGARCLDTGHPRPQRVQALAR